MNVWLDWLISPQPGGELVHMQRFADFRLLEKLGEGGAAEVYLATPMRAKFYADPGDPVAVKVYKPEVLKEKEQLQRISFELKASIEAAHPNVIKVFEAVDDHSDGAHLVMEFVDGMPLSRWGAMFCPLSDNRLVRLISQLVSGMRALSDAGIIHRDIKPDNVMISSSFEAKLMDLGVVRLTKQSSITSGERFLGSTRNASPELLMGQKYDSRTDIYSLGTVIYFLLHGYEVFHETNHRNQLVERVLHEKIEFEIGVINRSHTYSRLVDIAKRMLSKDPSERFNTIEEVDGVLKSIAENVADPVKPLHGYVASALTGLAPDIRENVAFITNAVARACKVFDLYVYQPRKATDPIVHSDVRPEAVYELDRKRVLAADVLVILMNHPSFGVGQEIEIAASRGVPTILLRREGIVISRMVTGSFLNVQADIIYNSPEDLEQKLSRDLPAVLQNVRSQEAINDDSLQRFGQRIRALREQAGFSQEEVASALCVPPQLVHSLEERSATYHNVGIVILDRLMRLYGTSIKSLDENHAPKLAPFREDPNLRALERVATTQKWTAEDFLLLRQDYQKELAASGGSATVDEKSWLQRHRSIEERRLRDEAKSHPLQMKLV
jgi:serine/threonine protein kinase/transcriptional regulator with XRE-family HTH domain